MKCLWAAALSKPIKIEFLFFAKSQLTPLSNLAKRNCFLNRAVTQKPGGNNRNIGTYENNATTSQIV